MNAIELMNIPVRTTQQTGQLSKVQHEAQGTTLSIYQLEGFEHNLLNIPHVLDAEEANAHVDDLNDT